MASFSDIYNSANEISSLYQQYRPYFWLASVVAVETIVGGSYGTYLLIRRAAGYR